MMQNQTAVQRTIAKRKKGGLFSYIGRLISVLMGLTIVSIGALLSITIIGIIPGMFIMTTGLTMIALAGGGKYQVKCGSCGKKMIVKKDVKIAQCKNRRCKDVTQIDWIH